MQAQSFLDRIIFSRFIQSPVLSYLKYRFTPILKRPAMAEFIKSFHGARPEVCVKINFLLDYCRGKNVAHFGFADYPYIKESLFTDNFLHVQLKKTAASVIGLDYSAEAVAYYREKTGDNEAYVGDIYDLEPHTGRLKDREIFLLGEIMEHLDNPGKALQSIRSAMPPDAALVVTVPNAFCLNLFSAALNSVELVHPDHVAWYSPNTLTSLLHKNGFRLEAITFCQSGAGKNVNKEFIAYPCIAEGIIGVFRKAV